MLSLRRWDQSLLLTLSLLPPTQVETFLRDVIEADLALALRAAKYMEIGRDEVVARLLSKIPERVQASRSPDWELRSSIESALEYGVPLTDAHMSQLRELIGLGDMIGAAAVRRLVALKGANIKDELLPLLVERCDDWNLCVNGVGSALKGLATGEDAKNIITWADSLEHRPTPDSNDAFGGFTSGAAELLSELDLSIIRREFLGPDQSAGILKVRATILVQILEEHHSTAALDLAGELLLRGVKKAAIAIYFISAFTKPDSELSWASFTTAHIECLLSALEDTDENWAFHALRPLCAACPDLAKVVERKASERSGIAKAVLLHCISPTDPTPVFQTLGELIQMDDEKRREQPIQVIREIDIDWVGKEELFVRLLKLRDRRLASALFGGSCPPSVPGLGNLEIGPIDWWLQWMTEVDLAEKEGPWFLDQMSGLFAGHLNREAQDGFVSEFNKQESKFRRLLLRCVLPFQRDITTDIFTEDAISFLLADLNQEESVSSFPGHLLGWTATEQFVTDRLLPLLADARQPLLNNLREVLKQAGARHGRRYVVD
jgi:hypothetical protein